MFSSPTDFARNTLAPKIHAAHACIALAVAPCVHAEGNLIKEIFFGAELELEIAHNTDTARLQKSAIKLEPELEATLPADTRFTAIARLGADGENELDPDEHTDADLREFYFEWHWRKTYVNIGKQQVVWGNADGLKVLDVVNPQTFREFILDDFADSRIPLWTVNLQLPLWRNTLQLVWIPDQTYTDLPEPGSVYEFTSPLLIPQAPPDIPVESSPVEKPDQFFKDSDVGIKLSGFQWGWDFSLNYLYHYEDNPVFYRTIDVSPTGQVSVRVQPRHERSDLLGGTFSRAFGDLTLRGELGYFSHQFFVNNDPDDPDGILDTHEVRYVVGLDWYGLTDTRISVQWFESHIGDDEPGVFRDRRETSLTLQYNRTFLNDTLEVDVLWLYSENRHDGLIRPRLSYDINDGVSAWIAGDRFYGDNEGFYGQFDDNDRVLLGVAINF